MIIKDPYTDNKLVISNTLDENDEIAFRTNFDNKSSVFVYVKKENLKLIIDHMNQIINQI